MEPRELDHLPSIGWREWIALPGIGIPAIKAKVDTGARSSALHAFDIDVFADGGRRMVRFKVHPFQRDDETTVEGVAELVCERLVRSSQGHESLRPVILTTAVILGQPLTIEVTLTRRDTMGFRMLLGREAIRRRFLVEPGRSYLGGKPQRKKRKRTSP